MFQSTHPHGVRHTPLPVCLLVSFVSIHAPARGATYTYKVSPTDAGVSIHAPARGATGFDNHNSRFGMFQSTHPHGVRPLTGYLDAIYVWFQSTHPHGVRHWKVQIQGLLSRFNPRTRTGCDGVLWGQVVVSTVSIHAPARGATLSSADDDWTAMFQSTHPHGVRPILETF